MSEGVDWFDRIVDHPGRYLVLTLLLALLVSAAFTFFVLYPPSTWNTIGTTSVSCTGPAGTTIEVDSTIVHCR